MNEWATELFVAFVMAVLAELAFDLSTRLARRLATWSARRTYPTDPERAATREREWLSVIEEAPKFLAMYHALLFAGPAVGKTVVRSTRKKVSSRNVRVAVWFVQTAGTGLAVNAFSPTLFVWLCLAAIPVVTFAVYLWFRVRATRRKTAVVSLRASASMTATARVVPKVIRQNDRPDVAGPDRHAGDEGTED